MVLDVPDDSLERISVGKLVTLPVGTLDEWLIGFVERIVCKVQYASVMTEGSSAMKADDGAPEVDCLVDSPKGTLSWLRWWGQ